MGLLQHSIEKKLSALLGTQVTFDKLSFSLLGGSVEATGVRVAGSDPAQPLLTVRRIRAEISLGAAFKKEFVIKSLAIEKPVLTIVRKPDGSMNLPPRNRAGNNVADTTRPSWQTSDAVADKPASDELEGTWKFEARKVLLLDGEIEYRGADGYRASVEKILGEVKEAQNGFDITLIADSVGRRDEPVDFGSLKMQGRADTVSSLAAWRKANVHGSIELGDRLRVRFDLSTLHPLDAKFELNGVLDPTHIARLLPADVKGLDFLRDGRLRGRVELNGRATCRAGEGIRLPDLTLRAADVVFSPAQTPSTVPGNSP